MTFVLTKSKYLNFLACPREYWLAHHKPELFAKPGGLNYEHRREEGYAFEREAKKLRIFNPDPSKYVVEFGCEFEGGSLYAKADAVITDLTTGAISIYEIKSSTKVKPEHIYDVAFQKAAAQAAGKTVAGINLILCNNKYVRSGAIDPEQLCLIEDVTERVAERDAETDDLIRSAIAYPSLPQPPPNAWDYCDANKRDCAFLLHHFPDCENFSVFEVSNLTREKRDTLLKKGVYDMRQIPEDFALTDRQKRQVALARSGTPEIDVAEIARQIDALEYPIHFLDYETFSSVIPRYEGFSPYQARTFQYSLHSISERGAEPVHSGYLATAESDEMLDMARHLRNAMSGGIGSVIVWSDSYEKTRNIEIAARYPEIADFLTEVNAKTFDLRDIFSKRIYFHPGFRGRDGLKVVLPVLTGLTYEGMGIADGMTASIKWFHLMTGRMSEIEREKTRRDLLEYCKLDTRAMVEIFNVLNKQALGAQAR